MYDKYSDEIIAKAEILSDEIVKEKLETSKCERQSCTNAIKLWKNKSTLVEEEFNKLLVHLKSQGVDVDYKQKEKTTTPPPAPPVAQLAIEPNTSSTTTNSALKSILNNVAKTSEKLKETPKTQTKPAPRAVRTGTPAHPSPPINPPNNDKVEVNKADKAMPTSSKPKVDASPLQTISSDSDNDKAAAPKTPRKKRKKLNRLSNVLPEQSKLNATPQRSGWGASPPPSPARFNYDKPPSSVRSDVTRLSSDEDEV